MGLLNENIAQAISDFNDIKSKIIENGVEVPEGTKTSEYAGKIDEVYEKATSEGYNIGKEEGYIEGHMIGKEEGIQTEYDRFWDAYQENGTKQGYVFAFAGEGWNAETFKPKYDIQPVDSADMFYNFCNKGTATIDMVKHLANLGVKLDFSKATTFNYAFQNARISKLGTIDFKSYSGGTANMFYTTTLTTIENMILYENKALSSSTFTNCKNLANLTISGVIAFNFTVSACTKLTHDSLMSIINHLKDYSGTGTTHTLTLGTTNLAKLTDEEKAIATEKGWTLA